MSIYENIMFSTIKSLRIFNSKLFYFGHSWEKLIEWLADNNDDDDDEGDDTVLGETRSEESESEESESEEGDESEFEPLAKIIRASNSIFSFPFFFRKKMVGPPYARCNFRWKFSTAPPKS